MGHTIWVEIQGRPLEDTADDSSIMQHLIDNLDALAEKLHVQKLSDFCDYSELEAAYGEFDEDAVEQPEITEDETDAEPSLEERQAKGEWFDAASGLKSVEALRSHLSQHFDDLGFQPDASGEHWPKDLMDELARCEEMLRDATSGGQRFRLLVVP